MGQNQLEEVFGWEGPIFQDVVRYFVGSNLVLIVREFVTLFFAILIMKIKTTINFIQISFYDPKYMSVVYQTKNIDRTFYCDLFIHVISYQNTLLKKYHFFRLCHSRCCKQAYVYSDAPSFGKSSRHLIWTRISFALNFIRTEQNDETMNACLQRWIHLLFKYYSNHFKLLFNFAYSIWSSFIIYIQLKLNVHES